MTGYDVSIVEPLVSACRELNLWQSRSCERLQKINSLCLLNAVEFGVVHVYIDSFYDCILFCITEKIQAKNRANIVQEDIQPGSKIINVDSCSNVCCSGNSSILDYKAFIVIWSILVSRCFVDSELMKVLCRLIGRFQCFGKPYFLFLQPWRWRRLSCNTDTHTLSTCRQNFIWFCIFIKLFHCCDSSASLSIVNCNHLIHFERPCSF